MTAQAITAPIASPPSFRPWGGGCRARPLDVAGTAAGAERDGPSHTRDRARRAAGRMSFAVVCCCQGARPLGGVECWEQEFGGGLGRGTRWASSSISGSIPATVPTGAALRAMRAFESTISSNSVESIRSAIPTAAERGLVTPRRHRNAPGAIPRPQPSWTCPLCSRPAPSASRAQAFRPLPRR